MLRFSYRALPFLSATLGALALAGCEDSGSAAGSYAPVAAPSMAAIGSSALPGSTAAAATSGSLTTVAPSGAPNTGFAIPGATTVAAGTPTNKPTPAQTTPTPTPAPAPAPAPTPTPTPTPTPAPAPTPPPPAPTPTAGNFDVDVEVPFWTQGDVYLALDQAVNGKAAWAPDAVKLTMDAQGRYRAKVALAAGTVSWKVTRGNWATVEKGPLGGEAANRTNVVGATSASAIYAHVYHWGDDQILPPPGRLQDLGVFAPRSLPKSRKVTAYLPKGYDDPANASKHYGVLYALDGQNLFDPSQAAFGAAWELDDASDKHVDAGRTPFIVIAIDNTSDRMSEYTPSFDASVGAGGDLENLAKFIFDELKPAVDALYRTKTGPEDTGILGSSLGGLAAIHVGFKHADKVRRIGAVSPSLWWNNEETKQMISSVPAKPLLRVWLDMGTAEGSSAASQAANVKRAQDASSALQSLGFVLHQDLEYTEVQGAQHNESSWAARLPNVLKYLFP